MDDTEKAGPQKGSFPPKTHLIKTDDVKPEGYDGTCLRPLGLCDLGGCCDICWYSSKSERSTGVSEPPGDGA